MSKQKKNSFFEMKASADGKTGEVFIYGEITKWAWEEYGEVSSLIFKQQLDDLGEVENINLYINSPGGSVMESMAIMSMLQRHPAYVTAYVDGIAASCATVIPMVADKVIMPANTLMMIHHAMTWAQGNAAQLRTAADDIERISNAMIQHYLDKAGDKLTAERLNEMLREDKWLTAEQAFEIGLCDEVTTANEAVAYAFDDKWKAQYKNVPKQLIEPRQGISAAEMAERKQIAENAKADLDYLNIILGGI